MQDRRVSGWLAARRTLVGALFGFATLVAGGCGKPLPATAVEVLDHADTFEVYALDPAAPAEGDGSFAGYKIVHRAIVADPAARERIRNIVDDGVRSGGTRAKCFEPRHGIHAVRSGHVVDLVICYHCGEVDVHEEAGDTVLATADVRGRLDAEFRAAGVETLPD